MTSVGRTPKPLRREPALLREPLDQQPAPTPGFQDSACFDLGPLLVRHARTMARLGCAVSTVLAGRLRRSSASGGSPAPTEPAFDHMTLRT